MQFCELKMKFPVGVQAAGVEIISAHHRCGLSGGSVFFKDTISGTYKKVPPGYGILRGAQQFVPQRLGLSAGVKFFA